MKRIFIAVVLLIILGVAALFFANSDSSSTILSVSKQKNGLLGAQVTITSKTNEININNVVLNRGNCNIDRWVIINGDLVFENSSKARNPYPIHLKFGQSASFVAACNDFIEAKIETNAGIQTFGWDK